MADPDSAEPDEQDRKRKVEDNFGGKEAHRPTAVPIHVALVESPDERAPERPLPGHGEQRMVEKLSPRLDLPAGQADLLRIAGPVAKDQSIAQHPGGQGPGGRHEQKRSREAFLPKLPRLPGAVQPRQGHDPAGRQDGDVAQFDKNRGRHCESRRDGEPGTGRFRMPPQQEPEGQQQHQGREDVIIDPEEYGARKDGDQRRDGQRDRGREIGSTESIGGDDERNIQRDVEEPDPIRGIRAVQTDEPTQIVPNGG